MTVGVADGGAGGVGGRGCAVAAPGEEEAGVSGGQREAVRLDHAPELRGALGGNGNLKLETMLGFLATRVSYKNCGNIVTGNVTPDTHQII